MIIPKATCLIKGLTPYSQSRYHEAAKKEKELADAYDRRTWREKMHVMTVGGRPTVYIPAHAIHQCVVAAAKYSKIQIPGQGKATWTAKFRSGIGLLSDVDLGIDPESVDYIDIFANADGMRGSGRRVMRRFPQMAEWSATFVIHVFDQIITPDVLRDMLETAGMYIGLGRFRPENGGTNGRFAVETIDWQEG